MKLFLMGFGSNMGDPVKNCLLAIEKLRGCFPAIVVTRVSSLYRTKPVGPVEQDWFVNGALHGETSLDPLDLLAVSRRIESELGRVRTVSWGPRTIDLDILAYGDEAVCMPQLHIPHPRLQERLFVLAPLAEIAPFWVHPKLGVTPAEMLQRFSPREIEEAVQPLETETK
ncbi:MAG: 2-amino-4-hydroxy-6-hydroxymethyldihydropteridine diphosphokinase [Deltaproteobacteria bacterium]|nr:2-amino-4-hydroxy-6-hydroxymethyldihydropteridine diphosphokinase [Deltaproteobacteria bacterium]